MKIRILKLAFLSFSFVFMLTSCTKTEEVTPQFQRCGNSLALVNGNLVIAGYNSNSSNGYDAMLMMANAATGDTLWRTTFGHSYSDAFYSVKKSNTGGIIAVGFTNRASASAPGMFAVITDANGKLVKEKTYGTSSQYTQGFNVTSVSNADSGYLIVGVIQRTSSSDRDIYLVRIDNIGDTLWTNSIGANKANQYDSVNDAAYDVIAAADGGYFVTGSLNGYTQNDGKIFLMKVSAKGDSLWTKTYGLGIGYSLTFTHENGVVNGIAISGSLQQGSSQDIFLLKTDLDGKRLWGTFFGGSGYEYGASMVETWDGGFAISGISDKKSFSDQDVYLITTNSSGANPQEYFYGGSDNDQGFGLVEMPDDKGFCITGLSNSGGSYVFLARVKANGTLYPNWTTNPRYIP